MAWAIHMISYAAWNIVIAFEKGAYRLPFWMAVLLAPAWGAFALLLNLRGLGERYTHSRIASYTLVHAALALPAIGVAWFGGMTFAWSTAEAGSYNN